MKNLIRGFFSILFMFVIPFAGIIFPMTLALGYYIDSNILVGIIVSAIIWMFSSNSVIICISFLASIIIPAVHGDIDLMSASLVFIALYFASPYLLSLVHRGEED